ncbi:hypothetical protein Pst134EB_027656 [Puccinia striiformis f. sp. tritici]|nr:hypothetical protein Pst134EB_027656 [Puccinia striiformis f. sp. tritici]
MNLLSLIIYLSCATTPAVLAAGAPTTPNPATTVVFTCADAPGLPTGWCVAKASSEAGGLNSVQANTVGPAKDQNYNCIGKPFGDNSLCCQANTRPGLTPMKKLACNCVTKRSIGT